MRVLQNGLILQPSQVKWDLDMAVSPSDVAVSSICS
jgi:hypothetical protein